MEDENFVLKEVPKDIVLSKDTIADYFTEEEREQLRKKNDWELPYREKLAKITITAKIVDPYPSEPREDAFGRISRHYRLCNDTFLLMDQDGRAVYFIRELISDQQGVRDGKGYLMMLLPDGSVSDMEQVIDLLNY